MEETERVLEVRENFKPESLLRYLTGINKQEYLKARENNADEYLWYIDKLSSLYNQLSTKADRSRLTSKLEKFIGNVNKYESVNKIKIYMSCLYIFGYISKETLLTTIEQYNIVSRASIFRDGKANIFRNILYNIPFGLFAEDPDIKTFSYKLEKFLYGTEDVKRRICQMITFNKYTKQYRPKPLLLIGPPATGKTKMAKTIAFALNKRAEIINLSGRMDVSFLYGMNSTWADAKPGALSKALSNMDAENGIIILDEIDKAGGNHSQIIDTLVPLLDPEQNYQIRDEFLDISLDFSKVFIIATANDKSKIPDYILDTFQVLEIDKYDNEAKTEIIHKYIIDEFNGILRLNISMTPQAGMKLAKSGVSLREAKRYIEAVISQKLMQKDGDIKTLIITEHDIAIDSLAPKKIIGFR